MKFHEIIPELLAGKRFVCNDWIRESRHIYAVLHDDDSFHLMWSDNDSRVTTAAIGAWVMLSSDEWEEYKEYPKNLDFVEACRLARDNGAIISIGGVDDVYDWHDGGLSEYWSGDPFEPDSSIFQTWHVVGYKGE